MPDNSPRIPDEQVGELSKTSLREEERLNNHREATSKADLDMLKAKSDLKVKFVRWGIPGLLGFIVLVVLIFLVVMGIHYIGHPSWRWLGDSDIARIEGALGGMLTVGVAYAIQRVGGNR